jgi:hypothetical protein
VEDTAKNDVEKTGISMGHAGNGVCVKKKWKGTCVKKKWKGIE